MKKRGIFSLSFILIVLFIFPLVLASSIESEIQKITYYAQEYETGNIDYVQLLVYTSSVRQSLNQILGATNQEQGGVLKQEQIKSILGEASESTKWVWVENEEQEKRMDSDVPIWKKIIFDGNKIQIRLSAFPSIFKKEDVESLVYRLNFDIEFKKPKDQLDISSKISEIQELAKKFNLDSSQSNAEELAKQSVNVERTFENYFRQSGGKCEDLMKSIFGSENQRKTQQLLVQEINFYEGDKFDVIARLEMCDDCEWNWINLDLWLNGRGIGGNMKSEESEIISPEQFRGKDSAYFKTEIGKLLDEYKKAVEEKRLKETSKIKQKIWAINEAWNQKSNDVWQQVDAEFQLKTGSFSEQNMQKFNENFGWIKQEQEKRQKEKEIRKNNYEERKQFYEALFSSYDKKEYYFEQKEFEKRLVEEFKEFGQEICNNNQDDNKNEQIDCAEDMCSGKICGQGEIEVIVDNQTTTKIKDLYCIDKICQQREDIILQQEIVCGNHKCEQGETKESCAEDCSLCQVYPAIECAGKVIFKGLDEKNCSLEPVCIEDKLTCKTNEECPKPLCGVSECIKDSEESEIGKCQIKELEECQEAECSDGDNKIQKCEISGSVSTIVIELCEQGVWKKTGIECSAGEIPLEQQEISEVVSGDVVGNACSVKEDCGGEDDVCSNGNCVSIPQSINIESEIEQELIEREQSESQSESEQQTEQPEEVQKSNEDFTTESENSPEPVAQESSSESSESNQETPSLTGEIIFGFFQTLVSKIKITGDTITGFDVENGEGNNNVQSIDSGDNFVVNSEHENSNDNLIDDEVDKDDNIENPEDNINNFDKKEKEDNERRDEDREREDDKRNQENKQRCEKDCKRPCIEKCIRDSCGQEMDCNVNEEQKKCEDSCQSEDSCIEKCVKGEGEWWKEFENKEEMKQEKGVFNVGGNCRTSQGKTEGFIWFGGWGEPFEKIQPLKNKYYSGGESDWCKQDLENLKIQRKEFENGFNQEFAQWFFEKYLANSAVDWEQSVSGIFELYWKNVDNQRQIAERMKCLNINSIDEITENNLISINYESEYGSIEYWEELKEVNIPGIEGKYKIISPYMKIWVFPNKEFIKYEMKKSMENHEFPGPPEDKVERENEEGPTAEEREMIKQDKKFMNQLNQITEKYNGNLDAVVQFKDFETDEVIFNLYAQVNEQDILKMKPMLVSEIPEQDVKIEIDFAPVYELIYSMEKDMRGTQIESPPWDRKMNTGQKIKEITNGIKMYFKIKSIINSAKITPEESRDNVKDLFNTFFKMMMSEDKEEENSPSEQKKEGKGIEDEFPSQGEMTEKATSK